MPLTKASRIWFIAVVIDVTQPCDPAVRALPIVSIVLAMVLPHDAVVVLIESVMPCNAVVNAIPHPVVPAVMAALIVAMVAVMVADHVAGPVVMEPPIVVNALRNALPHPAVLVLIESEMPCSPAWIPVVHPVVEAAMV